MVEAKSRLTKKLRETRDELEKTKVYLQKSQSQNRAMKDKLEAAAVLQGGILSFIFLCYRRTDPLGGGATSPEGDTDATVASLKKQLASLREDYENKDGDVDRLQLELESKDGELSSLKRMLDTMQAGSNDSVRPVLLC